MRDPQERDPNAFNRSERMFDELLDDEEITSPTPVPGLLGLGDDEASDVEEAWSDGTWRALDADFIPVAKPKPPPPLDWGWAMLMLALFLAAVAVVIAVGTMAVGG